MPNGTGRTVRVAVFARGAKAEEAKKAGADIVGAEDLMEIVQSGKVEFDRCISTPDLMPVVGRLGKVLTKSFTFCCTLNPISFHQLPSPQRQLH